MTNVGKVCCCPNCKLRAGSTSFCHDSRKPFEGTSTYVACYQEPIITTPARSGGPKSAFSPSNAPLQGYSVSKCDYRHPNPQDSKKPFRPCNKNIFGIGSFCPATSQRDAFVAKPYSKRCLIDPKPGIKLSDSNFACNTTYNVQYKRPLNTELRQLIRPTDGLCINRNKKVETETTQKNSFVTWPQQCTKSFTVKQDYIPPTVPVESKSVYRQNFTEKDKCTRTNILIPESRNIITPENKFFDESEYTVKYTCKGTSAVRSLIPPPTGAIYFGDAGPESLTTQRAAFPKWNNVERLPAKKRKDSNFIGDCNVKVDTQTTQKSDYVDRGYAKRCLIPPVERDLRSDAPFGAKTMSEISYVKHDPCFKREVIKFPPGIYSDHSKPMDLTTTQKEQFINWSVSTKQESMFSRGRYERPSIPFNHLSNYQVNFKDPTTQWQNEYCIGLCKCQN